MLANKPRIYVVNMLYRHPHLLFLEKKYGGLDAQQLKELQWSIDFISDALENGRKFRILNVMNDFNREALINEAYDSIPAEGLVNSLKQLI